MFYVYQQIQIQAWTSKIFNWTGQKYRKWHIEVQHKVSDKYT